MDCALPTLGLYLHVPFCRQKCVYCDFYSLSGAEGSMDAYVTALCAHLQQAAPAAAGRPVDSVYFGGGTPSYLGVRRLSAILNAVACFYSLTPEAEITLEANPDSLGDIAAVSALRRAGINRISLGMQSGDDNELAAIGRIHTHRQTAQAVETARSAGIDNLSLDLIYALPSQTMQRWDATLSAALALAPDHLSCYGLKVEPGTPLAASPARNLIPPEDLQADLYLYTAERLRQEGYQQYEISNFAKPGRESRHNLKYWTLGEYLGFGPGAHSDFGGRRFAWARSLPQYLTAAQSGRFTPSEENTLTKSDRAAEWLMLGLRTSHGLDPLLFRQNFSLDFQPFLPFLTQCRAAGYAAEKDARWSLTPTGFLLSNQIIAALLDTLAQQN